MTEKIIQKSTIIARLGKKFMDTPLEDIHKGVNALITAMRQALIDKRIISIRGFGTFKLQEHPARPLFNPRTRKIAHIPARKVPRFKPALSVAKRLQSTLEENN